MSSYSVIQYRPDLTGESINVAVVVNDGMGYYGCRVTSDWERVKVFSRLDNMTPLSEWVFATIQDFAVGKPILQNDRLRFTDFRRSTLPPGQLIDEISRLMLEGRV